MSNSKDQRFKPLCTAALAFFALALSTNAVAMSAQDTVEIDREALKVRDSVVLKSGTVLYGQWKSETVDDDGRKYVIFKTTSGIVMKLDMTKMIYRSKIRRTDEIDEEYNAKIDSLEDSAEGHWEICKWLQGQPSGKVRFKNQIRFHYERIMELDPNDERAKRALGYTYIRSQDRWVAENQYFESIGYEKSGTSWKPKRQNALSAQHGINESVEGERKLAFRLWQKEARKPNANAAVLRRALLKFCDEPAVAIVHNGALAEKDPGKRILMVDAIGRVPSKAALNSLCVFAIDDDNINIRERALALLGQEHYNQASAAGFMSQYFRRADRGVSAASRAQVLRAAFSIGELGDKGSVLPLVNALVTQHVIQPGEQAGRINTGVATNGNVESFSMGGDSGPVIKSFRNQETVDALKKITDQDFGFNGEAWKAWYIRNYTHHDIKVRR